MRYLAASVIIAAAGAVYELFSHGVYSYYMIYAFMIPLLCGAFPNLLAAAGKAEPGRHSEGPAQGHNEEVCSAASDLQMAAVAALTVGSLIQGALEIYGTTNRLMAAYPVLGLALMTAAAVTYAVCLYGRHHADGRNKAER